MEEDKKEVRLGLELSDADDYNVNADEAVFADEDELPEAERKKKGRSSAGRTGIFAAGFLCCVLLVFLFTSVLGLVRFVPKERYEYYRDLDSSYGKYYEIMEMIDEDPLAKSDAGEISDEELKEIVASTGDPYAEYFTAEEYDEFEKHYMGDYVGIGILVTEEDGDIVIKSVIPDGPAEEAGIQDDDILVRVDGKELKDVNDAIEKISGEAGTELTVTVKRGGETLDIKATRERIDQESVGYLKMENEPDVGYIMIAAFRDDTAKDLKLAVRDLKDEGCDKFILDLRGNGGGLTNESVDIADYLLPACRIMSEKTKSGKETVYNSKASSADLDLVVLVDENTASASEILTAALQDNNACTVIGKKTYGKGVTQKTQRFRDGSAIKITVTEYFRPSGKKVDGVGITPDIEAEGEAAIDEALKELKQ